MTNLEFLADGRRSPHPQRLHAQVESDNSPILAPLLQEDLTQEKGPPHHFQRFLRSLHDPNIPVRSLKI